MTKPDAQHDTRERLLQAAGEVFSEQGFRQGMVRDICQRAGANIAAVNYHFGDKEGLYRQVLRDAACAAGVMFDEMSRTAGDATPEDHLRGFVRGFLHKLLNPGRPAWHAKMMAREMMDPTGALDEMVEEHIRPMFTGLRTIVAAILEQAPDADIVRWNAASIIAQCLFFMQNRAVYTRLYPDLVGESMIDRAAQHVARFSLAALRCTAAELKSRSAS